MLSPKPLYPPPALLHNLPTPASSPRHSPILGHKTFTRPRASPPIDDRLGHPLLHMQLEPWDPPCVFFSWWFSLGVLVSSYCCSSYEATNLFSSLATFSSSFIGDPVLSPMDGCEHPLLYLLGTSRASQNTAKFGSCQQALIGIHNSVWVWWLYMEWIHS